MCDNDASCLVLFFLQIDYPEVQGGRGVGVGGGGRGSVTSANMDRSNVNLVFEDTVIICRILCFVDCASLYNLVNRTNLVDKFS